MTTLCPMRSAFDGSFLTVYFHCCTISANDDGKYLLRSMFFFFSVWLLWYYNKHEQFFWDTERKITIFISIFKATDVYDFLTRHPTYQFFFFFLRNYYLIKATARRSRNGIFVDEVESSFKRRRKKF